jgi:serine/threonine-protein kinase
MGSVYRAMHLSLGEPVAVKFMNDVWKGSDEHRTRFRREAAILARLRHPGIVSILDFGELDSELFMVMELVKGSPLSDFVVVPGRLSPPRIGTIFRDLLEVLAVAHAENVVHRDIKPENVMLLDSSDGVDRVKVLDFGIAYLADASRDGDRLTRTGDFRGTAHYMAPEQWRGNAVGAKADIYAVGVMLFEALTGTRPFDGPDLPALIMQHVLVEAPLLSTVGSCRHSRELESLVARTLAKDPATRPTARELGQEVYRLLHPPQHESATMEVAPVSGKRPVAA